MRYLLGALDADLRGAGELARLEAVADSFAEAYDAARWAISRRAPGSPDVQTLLGAERRDRYDEGAPDMRFTAHDESYALADYPLTAEVMEAGGGFAIEAADTGADPDERALLAQWGFTAVTAAAAIAPGRLGVARRALLRPAHARAAGRAARAAAAGRRGGRPWRPAAATRRR